jgi:hypothetical protein
MGGLADQLRLHMTGGKDIGPDYALGTLWSSTVLWPESGGYDRQPADVKTA